MKGASVSLVSAGLGWGRSSVLHDVNLQILPGEMVLLLGSSGSGKSTLLGAIAGLDCVRSGRVDLDYGSSQRAGFVPQSFSEVDSPFSAEEHVALGAPSPGWRTSKAQREAARGLLEGLGIGSFAHRRMAELSGGQRQRVMVARALMASKSLLLCDEPTSGADAVTSAEVANVLAELAKEGCTVIVASHDVAAFKPVCSRVVSLSCGQVVFDGPADLFDDAALRKTYATSTGSTK